MIIVLMGVSCAGKTTIGRLLAKDLGWRFYEGDAFHSQTNIEKMEKGVPLTDSDRESWLRSLRQVIDETTRRSEPAIIACSALKKSYRDYLREGRENLHFVYLRGDYDLIRRRLEERKNHFMDPALLRSQFDTLEEPMKVLVVDVSQDPRSIADLIKKSFTRSNDSSVS
jgi:gluconokinase